MPLNLRYPGATRKNTISKTTDVPAVAERNRSPQPGASLTASVNGVVPERPKQTLPKKQTDTPPRTLARKPSQASIYSTTSITEKKRSTWRGVTKTLPGILRSPRGASSTSLVSISQEPAPPLPGSVDSKSALTPRSKIPARRTTLPPKASTSDKPSTTPAKSVPLEESEHVIRGQKDITRTSNESDGSDTLVEELQSTARSLNEELSAMQHKLNETTNECSALHEHIRALESANDEQLRRSVEQAVKHAKDELLGLHASELGAQQDRILDLQGKNDGLTSQLMEIEQLKENSDRDNITKTNSLRRQLRDLQNSLESIQHDLKTKDDVVAGLTQRNEELYTRITNLEAESGALTEGAAEMEEGLLKDIGRLRHQLEDAQHTLSERDIQMSELQSEKAKVEDMLVCAQAAADEKETIIGDLKYRGNGLEERNEELERKILEREREETRLKATAGDYERRFIDAAGDARMLRGQLASSTSLAQQLQSSLDALSIEKESLQAATDKFNQLQDEHAALLESMQALESQNKTHQTEKADMIRIYSAEIEAERRAVRNLRRSMESIARDSGAKDDRSSVLVQANEELQQEIMNLRKLREGEEQESHRLRKELEENTVVISTLGEKNRVLLEVLTVEKEKLCGEADHLRRQLSEAKLRLQEHDLQAQSQGVDEQKRKEEVQKANAIIDEQRTVIGRLQQSIGELSKDDEQPPKPRLLLNVMKSGPSRTPVQRSQTSPLVANTLPSRPSPSPKRSMTGGNETHAPSIASSTSSTPLKTFKPTTSLDSSSHEASRMFTDHERAFQADSDSEGDHHSGCQRQLRDMKRGKAQTHASFAYKMGHAVFGSLWRKVWG